MGTGGELTADRIRTDVLEVLEAENEQQISDDEDLIDLGLDSIRVMHLVSRWRALGADITLVELAENPTINGWRELLSAQ